MHDLRELRGVIPPMITCFNPDDSVDASAMAREASFLLNAGVNGIVVGGSTGEGAGMSEEDLYIAVAAVTDAVRGRIPVIGGVIADNSHEAVRLGNAALRAGAVGLQVPPPSFYFSTETRVLAEYYRSITDGTGLPLIIYNVIPWAQVAVDSLRTICGENPRIIGVKQSGANIHALADLLANLRGTIRIYSAIDDLVYPSLMMGADGTISGTASVFPVETVEMMRCIETRNYARALELHHSIVPVWRTFEGPLFPSRTKYALSLLGRSPGKPRSPFGWPEHEDAIQIEAALRSSGFLSPVLSENMAGN
jgi:4-hydroxy-tetrahydrodipicolinate synthase